MLPDERIVCQLVKKKVIPFIEPIKCIVRVLVSLQKRVGYFSRASVIGYSNENMK